MNNNDRSKPPPSPEIEEKMPFSEEDRVSDGTTGLIKEIAEIMKEARVEAGIDKKVYQCAYGIIVY